MINAGHYRTGNSTQVQKYLKLTIYKSQVQTYEMVQLYTMNADKGTRIW